MNEETCVPERPRGLDCSKSQLTRKRYIKLVSLADRACSELKAHGLKPEEYCEFGRIVERMINLG